MRIRHSDDLPTFAVHLAITRSEADQKPTGTSSPDIHIEHAVEMVPACIDSAHTSSISIIASVKLPQFAQFGTTLAWPPMGATISMTQMMFPGNGTVSDA